MTLAFLCKVTIGLAYHPSKPYPIGDRSLNFDVFVQLEILFAYASRIEEEIHTS